jgi:hypothetical protein
VSHALTEDWLSWKHEQTFDAIGGGVMPLPKAPRVPASPEGQMHCERLRCVMAGRACVERQGAKRLVAVGGRGREERTDTRMGFCVSGNCEQGKEVRAQLGKLEPREKLAPANQRRGAASEPAMMPTPVLVPLTRLERRSEPEHHLTSEERAELAAEATNTPETPAAPAEEKTMAKLLEDKTDQELLELVDKHGSIHGNGARRFGRDPEHPNRSRSPGSGDAVRRPQDDLSRPGRPRRAHGGRS